MIRDLTTFKSDRVLVEPWQAGFPSVILTASSELWNCGRHHGPRRDGCRHMEQIVPVIDDQGGVDRRANVV
jgi:hypothetical protein